MTGMAKRKGDSAEREAAELLTELLGTPCRRQLGAGRSDDIGDIDGLTNCVVQVCDWADKSAACLQKPVGAEQQRLNAGVEHAVTMVRFRGGKWRMVMTPEQWIRLYLGEDGPDSANCSFP